jgi:arylformamidase
MSCSRRSLLAIGAGLVASRPARADPTVFLEYTQTMLDRAYDQSRWATNGPEIAQRAQAASEAVRVAHPPRTESYGPTPSEIVDIFAPTGASKAPVFVFYHGGAWLGGSKDLYAALAPTFLDSGAIYVVPEFDNAKSVGLPGMVAQCRRALAWVMANVARLGGDPARIVVAGHSSGAHLAGVLATTDWTAERLAVPPMQRALLLSGMYELYPVTLSYRQGYLHLSESDAAALSPLRHLDRVACPVLVAHADMDSPEFRRQSTLFSDVLAGMGRLAGRLVLFDTNHFEVPFRLADPQSELSRAALALLQA